MSDFAGLRLALSALQAQRRGLEVAAQNAANVNTEGYSRQRVDLQNIGAPTVPAIWSKYEGDGGGVRVADVVRYRDSFLEIRAALEYATKGSLAQGRKTMERIEQLFDEPSDTGMGQQLSEFWAGFDDVANHPGDPASRTQLLQRAATITGNFNAISRQLSLMARDATTELEATINDINSKSASIARLNAAIKANTVAGLSVNDLKDQRDLLATQLAELSGGSVRSGDFGMVNVVVNGLSLVQETHSTDLRVDLAGPSPVVRWANNNAAVDMTSGKAGGQLETINATIPTYIARLDVITTTMRDEVNALHSSITGSIAAADRNQTTAGNLTFQFSLDGGAFTTVTVAGADWSGAGGAAALQTAMQTAINTAIGAGNATVAVSGALGSPLAVSVTPTGVHTLQTRAAGTNVGFTTLLSTTAVGLDGVGGRRFFEGTTAATFAVSGDIAGNPNAVAAGVAAGGALDSSRALDLADLAQSAGGASATYRTFVVNLGVDTQTAKSRDDIQQTSVKSLDNARSQQSGVNIDEEMTHMVEFQHAYDAAARFLSAIDEMLDTLINRTAV